MTTSMERTELPRESQEESGDSATHASLNPLKSCSTSQSSSSPDSNQTTPVYPSTSLALFLYWIFPVFLLSIFGRSGVDTNLPRLPVPPNSKSFGVQFHPAALDKAGRDYEHKKKEFEKQFYQEKKKQKSHEVEKEKKKIQREEIITTDPLELDTSSWPSSYKSLVNDIQRRRPTWQHGPKKKMIDNHSPNAATKSISSTEATPSSREANPERRAFREKIDSLKMEYERDTTNVFKALEYADAMRIWGMTFFDGGSFDNEAIQVYTTTLTHLTQAREKAQQQGLPTNETQSGLKVQVPMELHLRYEQKSMDGLLCAVYTALGKLYFMAGLFERSEQALSNCLEKIEPHYLEAAHNRGSARIVLGKFEAAAQDYSLVIREDVDHAFPDAYSGMVRILETKPVAVPGGWDSVAEPLNTLIPTFENLLSTQKDTQYFHGIAGALRRFHHALFVYNDRETKDYDTAWDHLMKSHQFKLQLLPAFPMGSEWNRLTQIQKVFVSGFWPPGIGSLSKVPIFVIGFARSGSTLLERVLDAHPFIAGLGENSVFNGRLDNIRMRFVQASDAGGRDIPNLAVDIADEVVSAMQEQWQGLQKNTMAGGADSEKQPLRFVDKMLTNYFNVGFIHMLFPKALILHVIREPLDTLFSAYKHDFPSDRLAHIVDPQVLIELYASYRETINHWEQVLPNRITHIRYEDLVNDFPTMAQAIIEATGLPWDESVLDFHTKKHAVNTYSSTQVRKNVYQDSIQSWKRYETHLAPLINLLGDYKEYNQPSTIKKTTAKDEL